VTLGAASADSTSNRHPARVELRGRARVGTGSVGPVFEPDAVEDLDATPAELDHAVGLE
jgi:hypothetical protein